MPYGDYFGYFPTIPYETFDGSGKYKITTDIFRRVRATLQARTDKTIYYNYQVTDGERPEHVAYKYYGEAKYHWVLLLMNEVRDPQWQWPLDSFSFEKFIEKKYGSVETASTELSHYETLELRAPVNGYGYNAGDLILPAGIETTQTSYSYGGGSWSSTSYRKPIYKLALETTLNDNRRNVTLLRRNLLGEFLDEFESLVQARR